MERKDFRSVAGPVEELEAGIRRVLAPNPSPMTERGTNTYLVGRGQVAVIDPGLALPAHHNAILAALEPGESISHIFVTHSHLDHSPLAAPLSEGTGARIHAFGDSSAGRSEVMRTLAAAGLTGGGEGVDYGFAPHVEISDGTVVDGGDWELTAIWTPGHFGNHLCFAFGDAIFTGDHVMGWASTMVSPPDGDLAEYMASTERLSIHNSRVFYPGHGDPVTKPKERTEWLLRHRRSREASILELLKRHDHSISELTYDIYMDLSTALLPAAERNVFAHLVELYDRGHIGADPQLSVDARFFVREDALGPKNGE